MDDKKKDEKKEEKQEEVIDDASVILGAGQNEVKEAASLRSQEEVTPESSSKESNEQALLQKLEETEDKYRRALADYQNLVRRTQEEKREWARFSSKELVLKLLPILDTLMLAEKHTQDKNFVLTVQQFLQTLQQEGVERIKTIGEEFNPHIMEAVTTAEGEQNKVLEELRAGYMIGDAVLRSAQVIVGKKS